MTAQKTKVMMMRSSAFSADVAGKRKLHAKEHHPLERCRMKNVAFEWMSGWQKEYLRMTVMECSEMFAKCSVGARKMREFAAEQGL